MSILTISLAFFGVLTFLYFFWNRLKEDYTSNIIFSTAFYVLTGILTSFLILKFLVFPQIDFADLQTGLEFWLAILAGAIGVAVGIFRFKLRFFETVEACGVGLLYLLLAFTLSDTFGNLSIVSLAVSTGISLLLVLFYFLESKYRTFTWYKSGKVGFSGLTVLGIFFLLRALVAIFYPSVLFFLGKLESIPAGVVSFALFFAVYNLAKQK